ncbi:hypothetical protein E4T56_gene3818, partial [Termitomyces sp. T112]
MERMDGGEFGRGGQPAVDHRAGIGRASIGLAGLLFGKRGKVLRLVPADRGHAWRMRQEAVKNGAARAWKAQDDACDIDLLVEDFGMAAYILHHPQAADQPFDHHLAQPGGPFGCEAGLGIGGIKIAGHRLDEPAIAKIAHTGPLDRGREQGVAIKISFAVLNCCQHLLGMFGAADQQVGQIGVALIIDQRRSVDPAAMEAMGQSDGDRRAAVPFELSARMEVNVRLAANHGHRLGARAAHRDQICAQFLGHEYRLGGGAGAADHTAQDFGGGGNGDWRIAAIDGI